MARVRTGRQKNTHKHPLGEKHGARNKQQSTLQVPTLRLHIFDKGRPAKTHKRFRRIQRTTRLRIQKNAWQTRTRIRRRIGPLRSYSPYFLHAIGLGKRQYQPTPLRDFRLPLTALQHYLLKVQLISKTKLTISKQATIGVPHG